MAAQNARAVLKPRQGPASSAKDGPGSTCGPGNPGVPLFSTWLFPGAVSPRGVIAGYGPLYVSRFGDPAACDRPVVAIRSKLGP